MDTTFIDNCKFYDTKYNKNISNSNTDNMFSNSYLSIKDNDKTIECINNNCSVINKKVKFNDYEINKNKNSKKENKYKDKDNNFKIIIDTIIDYLYIFCIILLSISGILNKNSTNIIVLLFISILYIFYKKWIEKML
tara:strand:- start:275 stop:685 length:411 start_codon:yes stop_codon:yes gene_type:complete